MTVKSLYVIINETMYLSIAFYATTVLDGQDYDLTSVPKVRIVFRTMSSSNECTIRMFECKTCWC